MRRPCVGAPLTALVDGALAGLDRDRLLAHLARCDACRREVELQRQLKSQLRQQVSPPEPPAHLTSSLLQMAHEFAPVPAAPSRVRFGPAMPVVTQLLAAGLLVGGVTSAYVLGAPPPPAPPAASLATSEQRPIDPLALNVAFRRAAPTPSAAARSVETPAARADDSVRDRLVRGFARMREAVVGTVQQAFAS